MRNIRPLLVVLVAVALVAFGCGDSDDSDDTTSVDETTAPTVALSTTAKPEPVSGALSLIVDGIEGEEDKVVVALVGPDNAISDDLKIALAAGEPPVEAEDTSILLAFPGSFCDQVEDVLVDNQFAIRAMAANGDPCTPPGAEDDPEADTIGARDYPAYEFDPGDAWVFVGTFRGGETVAGRCATAVVSIDGDTTAALTLAPCSGS